MVSDSWLLLDRHFTHSCLGNQNNFFETIVKEHTDRLFLILDFSVVLMHYVFASDFPSVKNSPLRYCNWMRYREAVCFPSIQYNCCFRYVVYTTNKVYFYVVHTLYCVLCCDVVAVGEREPLVLLGRNSHLALEIIIRVPKVLNCPHQNSDLL